MSILITDREIPAGRRQRVRRPSSMRRDLRIIAILSVAGFVLAIKFDLFDSVIDWIGHYHEWYLDGLFMVLAILSVALPMFSVRRWRELSVEIRQRLLAEEQLRQTGAGLESKVAERTIELESANEQLQYELKERQSAQDARSESEKRYRQIVEEATDIIYRTDLNGNFTFLNSIAIRIMKRPEQQLLGRNCLELIHPDWRAQTKEVFERQFRERTPYTYLELPVIAGDGRQIWLGQNVQLLTENGRCHGFQSVARDVTELKQSQEALHKAEEYRNLFQLANDPIMIVDPEGEIVIDVNGKACEVYGFAREEFIGRSLIPLSQDPIAGKQHIDRLLTVGHSEEFETVQFRADGTPLNFVINATLIDYQGCRAVLSVHRDVTSRHLAEEARVVLEEQLRQSQKMEAIGQLAGGVAHDFNNLLAVISGYSELLLLHAEPKLDEQAAQKVEQIRKAADRAAILTRQLLAFSRKQMLQPKTLDLNEVIGDTEKMLRRLIGEHIALNTLLKPDLGQVRADPGQIEQVLMNLAVNARDAMPHGGKLTIETDNVYLDAAYVQNHRSVEPGPHVMIAVRDTGVGMNPEVRSRIFEPFFTTKEVGRGTGLGLSTVYGIVKQSGGHIWVYSEPGQGTTFKVYMPRLVAEVAHHGEMDSQAQENLASGKGTVLLVEDEEIVRENLEEILKTTGYQVLTAAHGKEALEVSVGHEGTIDLMLTDVVMPRMSGLELAERLAASRPDMRVIYMSGYTDDAICHHGVLDAGTALLEKPFTRNALLTKITEATTIKLRPDGQHLAADELNSPEATPAS